MRSLVGSCGRVGPPVQVGQRTRSECRGVLKVVVEVSAIRARLATASIVGSTIGVHHSLFIRPRLRYYDPGRLRDQEDVDVKCQVWKFCIQGGCNSTPEKKKKTRKREREEEKKEERRRGEAAHKEAGQRVSFDFDGVHPEGAHQFQVTVFNPSSYQITIQGLIKAEYGEGIPGEEVERSQATAKVHGKQL